MKTNFWTLYFRMFYNPGSAFETIFKGDKSLKYGFLAFLIPTSGYTLFYIMACFAGGSPSTFKPWLAIPIEEYFKYDIILTFPGYYLGWIGASATVYFLSRLMNGQSKFDNILAIMGFGIGVATWSSLLHDLTDAFLSIIGIIDMREYEKLLNEPTFWRGLLWSLYSLYFFWFLTLFTIGIKKAQGFSLFKSILIALAGLFTFQFILLIFIR
ncbi:MAG: hypothetical protein HGA37_13860 [Lentimicrobium sp.]|nr:hypothetical protein [Lentimicrobium sp.]